MISREQFRARRLLADHKQESLAAALGCTRETIQNFESGRTSRMYVVDWAALARELRLDQAA
jgi:DNA-binding XRE family transcriptional regulator